MFVMFRKTLFGVLLLAFVFQACEKENSVVFNAPFNAASELQAWVQTGEGTASIDSASLKLASNRSCLRFETSPNFRVKAGATYEVSYKTKAIAPQMGESGGCAGHYMLVIQQAGEDVIYKSFAASSNWVSHIESFTAGNGSSLNIAFLSGTPRGFWIDDFKITEIN